MKKLKLIQIAIAPKGEHYTIYGLDINGQVWIHDFQKWHALSMKIHAPTLQPQSALNSFLDKADAPQDIPDD